MRKHKRPSRTRRHRESVAAKRRARAFYRLRRDAGALRPDEAEALRPWLGCGVAVLVIASVAVAGWLAARLFS